jgi:hypothetical protein
LFGVVGVLEGAVDAIEHAGESFAGDGRIGVLDAFSQPLKAGDGLFGFRVEILLRPLGTRLRGS